MSAVEPCLIRSYGAAGGLVVRVGVPLADDHLEFLAGRRRPNTVLAAGYDAYFESERSANAATDSVFVVLKGPHRGQPLTAYGLDEVLEGARRRAGLTHATCHELRHTCLTRLREAGIALEAVQAQAGHGPVLLPTWEQLTTAKPQVTGTMRRYLTQIGCVL